MKKSILKTLAYPSPKANLLAAIKNQNPFFVKKNSKLDSIVGHKQFHSVDRLLTLKFEKIAAMFPDFCDEYSATIIQNSEVKKFLRNNMSVSFKLFSDTIPEIQNCLDSLMYEIGYPLQCNRRSLLYVLPDKCGTGLHYDQNVNFIIQVKGKKIWHLAKNEYCLNPVNRYTMGTPLDPYTIAHSSYASPKTKNLKFQSYQLEPGSVLFVPHGYWHSTESIGESISLNFTFGQFNWSQLMTSYLHETLSKLPKWRSAVSGLNLKQNSPNKEHEILVDELKNDIGNLLKDLDSRHLLEKAYTIGPILRFTKKKSFQQLTSKKFEIHFAKNFPSLDQLKRVLFFIRSNKTEFSAVDIAMNSNCELHCENIQIFLIKLFNLGYLNIVR